ncbi:MAG: hypothetical protein HKM24_04160, partial [Gammaproteobacteria bacterium]|nr:hypothetical protein [Gammaproteobacteria bacterium]
TERGFFSTDLTEVSDFKNALEKKQDPYRVDKDGRVYHWLTETESEALLNELSLRRQNFVETKYDDWEMTRTFIKHLKQHGFEYTVKVRDDELWVRHNTPSAQREQLHVAASLDYLKD